MTHSTVALQLFDVLCPGVCIMTEDVMNNASFMSCVSQLRHQFCSLHTSENSIR